VSASDSSACDSLEALKASLSMVREFRKRSRNRDFPYGASALEKYVYGELCPTISYKPAGEHANYQHLIFHRIPRHLMKGLDSAEVAARKKAGVRPRSHFEADRMLVVRHLGDFSNYIEGAGRFWGSRVWLLSEKFFDQRQGKSSPFFRLSLSEYLFQAVNAVRPRVVNVEPPNTTFDCADIEHPVKGMLEVDERIPEVVPNFIGRINNASEFVEFATGLRFLLNHNGEGLLLDVGVHSLVSTRDHFACPVNLLLDWIKFAQGS
jgi:hypothetical protein